MGARPLINFLKNNSAATETDVEDETEKQEEETQAEPEDAVKAFKKEYARKLGWTSKEEWDASGRDTNMWRDEETFLEQSPAYFERLRKLSREQKQRLERTAQAAAAALEDERRRGREEAEREAREAATAGDPDRAAAAVARAANAGPPPETVTWIAENPWFNSDPEARAVAAATVERLAARGATVAEQLKAARETVQKRYPEHFEDNDVDELPEFITRQPKKQEQELQREVKMSDSRVAAAAASPTSSARVRDSRVSKEKTFRDIPAADQATYEKYFARKFQSRNMTAEQARERYAKTYFGNKE